MSLLQAITPAHLRVAFGSAASVAGGTAVLAWRVHETRRPVTLRGIVIPPIGMSTGLSMFAMPAMRVPPLWGLTAFLIGALLFSVPLTRTSRLERVGDRIMLRRSRAFLAVVLVLAGLRFALRGYLDQLISPLQTAALFYLLAFGMILYWRARMLADYRRLTPRGS